MKLACQDALVPGRSFAEKLANLHNWGYEGVELTGSGIKQRVPEVKAALADSPVRVSTICGWDSTPLLLAPDKAARDQTIAQIRDNLTIAAEVGARGVICVPMFGSPRVPDLSPLYSPYEIERLLLVKLVRQEIAPCAEDLGVLLLLEPLNRYEAHIPKDLKEGVVICKEIASPAVRLMADFFHMNIEEADIAGSLTEAGDYLQHVHLADSNRQLPGLGHTDFAGPFAALKRMRYQGYMALECGVPSPAEESLTAAARFLGLKG